MGLGCEFYFKVLVTINLCLAVFLGIISAYLFYAMQEALTTARDYLKIKIHLTGVNVYDKL